MPRLRIKDLPAAAAVVLSLGLAGCLDLFGPECDDCPSDAHWEYRCIGIVAPDCKTRCFSGDRLLDDCCCGDRESGKAVLEDTDWQPLKARPD